MKQFVIQGKGGKSNDQQLEQTSIEAEKGDSSNTINERTDREAPKTSFQEEKMSSKEATTTQGLCPLVLNDYTRQFIEAEGNLLRILPKQRIRIELVPASFEKETFELYCKYQVKVHKDKREDLSPESFSRFLVESPLTVGFIIFYYILSCIIHNYQIIVFNISIWNRWNPALPVKYLAMVSIIKNIIVMIY